MKPIDPNAVAVGTYSLESLTTGMYEDPLHCMREYVQNGFDAIRAARDEGLLAPTTGLVSISVTGTQKRPNLTVEDNGIGVPAASAVNAFVSLGASRKRSNVNAGFRGIGRLAGVAYCTTLRFVTTVRGEAVATVVEFDCARMRSFMRPSAELQDVRTVLHSCASTSELQAQPEAHGTKVEMIGLTGLGTEFAEIGKLVPYLRQVCPTDFSDRFTFAERIRNFAVAIGQPIPTIDVETRYKRERTQILKAYDDSTPTANPKLPSTVTDVAMVSSAELGWFGWIGKSNFKGELNDDGVAGVRFRIKNIQIDGSDLIEALASELTTGKTEGRLQRWAVGEIYITNQAVVPNARRDGFEDSPAWREMRADIKAKVAKHVVALVRQASTSRQKIKKIAGEIAGLQRRLNVDVLSPADADALSKVLDSLLTRLKPDKLTGGDPNEVGKYISQVKSLRERLSEVRSRPPADAKGGNVAAGRRTDDHDEDDDDATDGVGAADMEGGWSPDELLPVLREIMAQELGRQETDRLFRLAAARLDGE